MNRLLVLASSLLLAAALAGAQDTLGNGTKPEAQDPNSQATSQSSTAQNTVIRGCLSGSAGNFTLTDQNGMQCTLIGDDGVLQPKVGHEIEITGTKNSAGEASGNQSQGSTAPAPNGVQVSAVRDVSGSCRLGHQSSSQPLTPAPPDK
jgi:hypothetical protein